jgi:predicted SAM-dependent methyltransferase
VKLNLGCGFAQYADFTNVDSWDGCEPDVVCDLENEVWPFEDNSVEYILMDHSLEHMGETTKQFFHVMKELYRVCKDGAVVEINVPHPQSQLYTNDPTHVRPIYPETIGMLSKAINERQVKTGMKNSKLALQTNTDFEITSITLIPDNRLAGTTQEILEKKLLSENNVASEIHMKLKVIKL